MRGFDSAQYLREQSRIITERLQQFKGGKLYLEIGTPSWLCGGSSPFYTYKKKAKVPMSNEIGTLI